MQLIGKDLAARRGGMVLFSGLDFRLAAGEMLAITGPNGVGKSTLLRIITGRITPAAGAVRLREGEISFAPALLCHYLGGKNAMKARLSVIENLQFWASYLGGAADMAEQALEAMQLAHTAHLPFYALSTGQRQRVAFARLLLAERPLWILDELTSGLDKQAIAVVAEQMRRHLQTGGMIVAATHLPLGLDASSIVNLSEYAA